MPDTKVVIRFPSGEEIRVEGITEAALLLSEVLAASTLPARGTLVSRGGACSEMRAPAAGAHDDRRTRAIRMLDAVCRDERGRVPARELAERVGLEGPRGLGPVFRVLRRELREAGIPRDEVPEVVRPVRDAADSWWVRGPRAAVALRRLKPLEGRGEFTVRVNPNGRKEAPTETETLA
mgnify:CR=1 FL=1